MVDLDKIKAHLAIKWFDDVDHRRSTTMLRELVEELEQLQADRDRLQSDCDYWIEELDRCQEGRDSIAAERDLALEHVKELERQLQPTSGNATCSEDCNQREGCDHFVSGPTGLPGGDCDGDGHYMCRECVLWSGKREEP